MWRLARTAWWSCRTAKPTISTTSTARDFYDINKAAFSATVTAHSEKLPCLIFDVPALDAYNFGQLIYFFQFACYIRAAFWASIPSTSRRGSLQGLDVQGAGQVSAALSPLFLLLLFHIHPQGRPRAGFFPGAGAACRCLPQKRGAVFGLPVCLRGRFGSLGPGSCPADRLFPSRRTAGCALRRPFQAGTAGPASTGCGCPPGCPTRRWPARPDRPRPGQWSRGSWGGGWCAPQCPPGTASKVVGRRPAVHPQLLQRDAGVLLHGVQHVAGLVCDGTPAPPG